MATPFKAAVESYLRAKALSRGTRNEYLSTLRKWEMWGGGGPVEGLARIFHPPLGGRPISDLCSVLCRFGRATAARRIFTP